VQPAAEVLEQDAARVRLRDGTTTIEVTALAAGCWRIGYFPLGRPVDYASEATEGARWEPPDAEIRRLEDSVEVVAHDVSDELRDGAAEGRAGGRYLFGEVDTAYFRQKIHRLRAGDPHQRSSVGGV
jgi:hypothetical protein